MFTHAGRLFTNTGCNFGPAILADADCFPLLPVEGYTGAEPRRYSYEGKASSLSAQPSGLAQK